MKFSINRENLLKPLSLVNGVVERKKNLPILSNLLLSCDANTQKLTLLGSDLETEISAHTSLDTIEESGDITVSAKKLFDIVRAFSEGSLIHLFLEKNKLHLQSGASRFHLASMPAADFPKIEEHLTGASFDIKAEALTKMIQKIECAISEEEGRPYLRGAFWDIGQNSLKLVATDGHRLSMAETSINIEGHDKKAIVPRKAIFEMSKMLASVPEETVKITLTQNHLHLVGSVFVLVTKLIDLKYPDYHKVIPRGAHLFMRVKKEIIKTVLLRVSILSNEKFRGVHFNTEENLLKVFANNPEHEEAEEKIAVNYPYKESLQIGFNVGYLLDAINSYSEGELLFSFTNADSSVLIEQEKDPFKALHVIMPMLL